MTHYSGYKCTPEIGEFFSIAILIRLQQKRENITLYILYYREKEIIPSFAYCELSWTVTEDGSYDPKALFVLLIKIIISPRMCLGRNSRNIENSLSF